MKMKRTNKILSLILCIVLSVVMALFTVGCNDNTNKEAATTNVETKATDDQVLGEGKTEFTFVVVDKDGKETKYQIHTDKTTVGEALLELELISGDESDYGLYVKEVNGISADYDTDGTYWAFYVDGEYASAGVDQTTITPGAEYSFKVEK